MRGREGEVGDSVRKLGMGRGMQTSGPPEDRCHWGLPGGVPAENCSITISKDSRTCQSCILSIVNIPQERILSQGWTGGFVAPSPDSLAQNFLYYEKEK